MADRGNHNHEHSRSRGDAGGHRRLHHHSHAEFAVALGDRRIAGAIAINLLLTIGQIVGGIISGSLALIADALHNLNDAIALLVALVARKIARRPADKARTFGYGRAEVVGALINLTALVIVGLFLLYEAVMRLLDPQPIDAWIVIIVGAIALVVDLGTVLLTMSLARHSINVRAAFIHNLADAMGSVAVIISGTLALLYGWHIADVIATFLIAGYVMYHGVVGIRESAGILMQSTPPGIDFDAVVQALNDAGAVVDVHHVHIWQLDERHAAVEAHIVIEQEDVQLIERTKRQLKQRLAAEFDIYHSTLEFEFAGHALACTELQTSTVPNC